MSRKIAEELLPRLRLRYTGQGRKERSLLMDELCEQWGYSRKHAIKLLGAKTGWGGDPAVRKGRPPKWRRCCGGFFSAPRDDTARASCGNGPKAISYHLVDGCANGCGSSGLG